MSKPNRTVWKWRNSRPSLAVVEQHPVSNMFDGDQLANKLRAEGRFDRVVNASYKIGPRNEFRRVFVVRCYAKLSQRHI